MKASADELLALLPGKITPQWPDGERFIKALAHGSMTVHFVAAGVEHRFEDFTADFATWVVFWGPKGGEQQEERGAEAGTAGNAG